MEASGSRHIGHRSRRDEFHIWNLSDLHFGNRGCALPRLKKDIRRIAADPFAFWIGGGDYADYIGLGDKRFDPDCVPDAIRVKDLGQLGRMLMLGVYDLLSPIRDKCLGMLLGNHEREYQKAKAQTDLQTELCNKMGVPNLQYCGMFDLCFHRGATARPTLLPAPPGNKDSTTFRFFVHHGAGFAQTRGGKLNRLLQFMAGFDADIYMVGHVHDQVGSRIATIGADRPCTTITERIKLGMISGSYLRTYAQGVTTYGEQRGYAPVPLGASFVRIRPFDSDRDQRLRAEI